MSDIAIKVENLSKRYRIGLKEEIHDTLAGALSNLVRRPVANLRRLRMLTRFSDNGREAEDVILALKNVSFEVKRGEVLGIIGRNGAGKSTLLKILARITQPTTGRAEVRGRVSSLLEVGTGFHPELTGRENIYLNGTILGMTKAEIDLKFDEIVDFSGVEKFIDTPVKRYSSGMRVRLAFSVAAHLEPEILLIDEVLSVGDAEFQKKCLGKIQDVTHEGRTVLFVSHNLAAVTRLCKRTILLDSGELVEDGPSNQVVAAYLHLEDLTSAEKDWTNLENAPGNEYVKIRSVRVINAKRATIQTVDVWQKVGVEICFEIIQTHSKFVPWIALYNERNEHIFSAFDTNPVWRQPRKPGRYNSVAWIPGNLLNEGTVIVCVSLNTFASGGRNIRQAHVDQAVTFQVVDAGEGDTARGDYGPDFPGSVRPLLVWTADYSNHYDFDNSGKRDSDLTIEQNVANF